MKRRLNLEIKEITSDGTFEGILSPYGNVDLTGDIVEPGAFKKTLQERGSQVPLLWQHRSDMPIGNLTLEERPDGLWCKGQLLLSIPLAQQAYLLAKAKIVKGLSIGFETVKDSVENGVRHLKEIRLWEGSMVTFPANLNALITTVKSAKGREVQGDFNEELGEIQLQDAGYQMRNALSYALSSVTWGNLTREEKIAAAETVIQQFHDAFMAYFPAYLDMLTEMYGEMETWSAKKFETKEGRKISAATKEQIQGAHDHVKSATDILFALLDEGAEAVDDSASKAAITPETKAAAPKPEPVAHHSAINPGLLADLKGAFTWNRSSSN